MTYTCHMFEFKAQEFWTLFSRSSWKLTVWPRRLACGPRPWRRSLACKAADLGARGEARASLEYKVCLYLQIIIYSIYSETNMRCITNAAACGQGGGGAPTICAGVLERRDIRNEHMRANPPCAHQICLKRRGV